MKPGKRVKKVMKRCTTREVQETDGEFQKKCLEKRKFSTCKS